MLLNTLLALNLILIALHFYLYAIHKSKDFRLSISIRVLTLGLFGFIILDHYESHIHFVLVLLSWVVFEVIENFYKKTQASSSL